MRRTRTEERAYYTCDYCDYVLVGVTHEAEVKALLRWRGRSYHFHDDSGATSAAEPWDSGNCMVRWLDAQRAKRKVGA